MLARSPLLHIHVGIRVSDEARVVLYMLINLYTYMLNWIFFNCVVVVRPPEAPVRNGVLELVDNVKRGRGRSKLTWVESVKRDLKDWNISKEIVLDRSAWRLAINVLEP